METATFDFGREIPAGSASLYIRFNGTLNDQLRGFYRSQYTDPEGQAAVSGHNPVRGHRRPPRLPLLGRPRSEGHLST